MCTNYGLGLQRTLNVDVGLAQPNIYLRDQLNGCVLFLNFYIVLKKKKINKSSTQSSRPFLPHSRAIVLLGLGQVIKENRNK